MSLSTDDDDGQERFVLAFLFALILLVVAAVIGVGIHKSMARVSAAKPAAAATAAQPEAALEEARVVVENGVVKFYFATAKADLAPGANEALADVVKGVTAGKTAIVSGFHDATGDLALNQELAKKRAESVRDALKALGVAEDKIELKKPEETQASGSNAEARRVEVVLAP